MNWEYKGVKANGSYKEFIDFVNAVSSNPIESLSHVEETNAIAVRKINRMFNIKSCAKTWDTVRKAKKKGILPKLTKMASMNISDIVIYLIVMSEKGLLGMNLEDALNKFYKTFMIHEGKSIDNYLDDLRHMYKIIEKKGGLHDI